MRMKVSEARQKPLIPAGQHIAICYSIIDFGTQDIEYKGIVSQKRRLQISWEFPFVDKVTFNDEKGPQVMAYHEEMTASLSEKANLHKILTQWRNTDFKADEEIDLEIFIGQPAYIQIIHNQGTRNPQIKYNKMNSIVSAPKELIAMKMKEGLMKTEDYTDTSGKVSKRFETENKKIHFSMQEGEFDPNAYNDLYDWDKEKIALSKEYQMINALGTDEPSNENGSMPGGATQEAPVKNAPTQDEPPPF